MSRNPNRGILQYLHGNWVYYTGLRTTTFYPDLIAEVDPNLKTTIEASSNLTYLSNYFLDAASVELTKEKAILAEKFGYTLEADYTNTGFAAELIKAINTCLGIKEIFERNLALILESNGQKNLMSWFPTYFEHAWEEMAPQIWDQAAQYVLAGAEQGEALK